MRQENSYQNYVRIWVARSVARFGGPALRAWLRALGVRPPSVDQRLTSFIGLLRSDLDSHELAAFRTRVRDAIATDGVGESRLTSFFDAGEATLLNALTPAFDVPLQKADRLCRLNIALQKAQRLFDQLAQRVARRLSQGDESRLGFDVAVNRDGGVGCLVAQTARRYVFASGHRFARRLRLRYAYRYGCRSRCRYTYPVQTALRSLAAGFPRARVLASATGGFAKGPRYALRTLSGEGAA
jgi:hypothetical protein